MLKKRIIACLVVKNGIVVQSMGFHRYLPVGKPRIATEFLTRWGVDEIILVDIDAGPQGRVPDYAIVEDAAEPCGVPLAVGGGITGVEHIERLLHSGADKVVLNKAAFLNPELVEEAAKMFGDQCVVVSMDAGRSDDGGYGLFVNSGRESTGWTPESFAKEMENRGAGELFLNSIDRDGSRKGYDMELISRVADAVNIPVIVCGGVGHPEHFLEALRLPNVAAAAAANFFHFTEHSVGVVKRHVKNCGIDVRIDLYADYSGFSTDSHGRLARREEEYLEDLLFQYYPDEII